MIRCALLLGSLVAFGSFGPFGCDKGPARECDSRIACAPPLVCDLGANVCIDGADTTLCSVDGDCTDSVNRFCATEINKCVPCLADNASGECPNGGVCSKNTCSVCTGDEDCDTQLCLLDGACAPSPTIAFVTDAGTVNTNCTAAEPCTLQAGVDTGRRNLRLRGAISVAAAVPLARSITLLGARTSRTSVTRSTPGPIFDVSGDGEVQLFNLELTGATGTDGDAIKVSSGSPSLTLYAVDVIGNSGLAVSAGTANLRIVKSLLVNNAGGGVSASAPITLENNILVGNGSATSAAGGVLLTSTAAANVIRFNTFAGNLATAGTATAVSCGDLAVRLSSNIFAGAAPLVSTCTTAFSLFPAGTTVAGTDKAGDPMFASTTLPVTRSPDRTDVTYYHLMTDSPARSSGETPPVAEDFEGDLREDAPEIGADEL